MVLDNGKAKITSVESATTGYLIRALAMIGMMIAVTITFVWHCLFRYEEITDIGLLVILLPMILLFLSIFPIAYLPAYRNRKSFLIYFEPIENADIKWIKENCHIHKIDAYGVVFVEKQDAHLLGDWKLYNDFRNTKQIAEEIFKITK